MLTTQSFFRNRLLAKAKLPILPIFNPIFTFLCAKASIGKTGKKQNKNKKKQIFTLCALCVLCVLELNVKIGKIGLKIAQIGNLVAFGDGF